jgi:predicted nuclease with RNAse H fold
VSPCWAGVDVGAKKGFDVALIDERRLVAAPGRVADAAMVVKVLTNERARVVAVDSPRTPAPDGRLSRAEEADLVRAVCGIRYTPNMAELRTNPGYYGWILNGFELYAALDRAAADTRWRTIECFPTATWTRLGNRRQGSRARWSDRVLRGLGIEGLPPRMNQDARDAIGAAHTAFLFDAKPRSCETFGDIVVPRGPSA